MGKKKIKYKVGDIIVLRTNVFSKQHLKSSWITLNHTIQEYREVIRKKNFLKLIDVPMLIVGTNEKIVSYAKGNNVFVCLPFGSLKTTLLEERMVKLFNL